MNFEDALIAMKSGAKITHPFFEADEYFQACRVKPIFGSEPLEDLPQSIVKMKGEFIHPDMNSTGVDDMVYKGTMIVKQEFLEKPCKHGFMPQMNLFLLMSDAWVVVE